MDYVKAFEAMMEALSKVSELAINILVQAKQMEADLKAKVEAMKPSEPPDKDKS